jgi:Tol biopolymer transport system component
LPIGNALSWSGDGSRVAFGVSGVKSTASGPFGTGWQVVAVADAASGRAQAFPRAFLNAGEPVMAPDGDRVAFQRVKAGKLLPDSEDHLFKSSIWLLDVKKGSVRRLTRWRRVGFLEPISFTSDGSAVVASYLGPPRLQVVAVDLDSHRLRRLAPLGPDDFQPTYSPDGSRLAFVRVKYLHGPELLPARPVSELLVARANGSGAKPLLRRRGYISSLSWDPSGSRLAFVRDPAAEGTGELEPEPGNKVMAINADGTCLMRVLSEPDLTVESVAWQPGPGRAAGPISC